MEINLPPDPKVKVEIAESNLLTLRINEKGDVFWNVALDAPQRITVDRLPAFLKEQQAGNPKLVVLLKIDRMAKYNLMVNFIDELNLAGVQRFSLAPLLDQDKQLLARVPA
jgi:biopolymer transport protein ExbD